MPEITITWPEQPNEHGRRLLWFASWLVGHDGTEAEWFYSGRGGERTTYSMPASATGIRIRRWPNEGLEPEYVDIAPLDGLTCLEPEGLQFDSRQRFSRLPDADWAARS